MKKQTKKQPASEYDALIEPFIEEATKHRGYVVKVAEQLSTIVGRTISRQQVAMWMNKERAERVEPSYSTALKLIEAINQVRQTLTAA